MLNNQARPEAETDNVEPDDVIEFTANLSGLTSRKLVNLLALIEK